MAVEWRRTTAGDIASPARNALVGGPFGSNLTTRDFVASGVPVIQGRNMGTRWVSGDFVYVEQEKASSLRANLARAGDLVFTQRGTLGQVSLISTDGLETYVVSQSQMKLSVDRDLADPLYVYYYFSTDEQREYMRQHAIQTGIPHTNLGILRNTPVLLPPLPEQRAIAQILGTLDDKIELNRRMNETLESIARALFRSWFVDFEPVRAKSEGRAAGLPTHLADLFPDSFENSELGEIPAGWSVRYVHSIADVVYGAPFASTQFNAAGIGSPLIRIRDLVNESPGVWTTEVLPRAHMVRPGDIVVGMDGEFRAYVWGGASAWLNQRVCAFVPKGSCSAAFVLNSIVAPLAGVEATETATTVIHLGKADIDRFRVVVPTDQILSAFAGASQPLCDRIVAGKQESRSLVTVRESLLPKLVSGGLRVKDAERIAAGTNA
jgi:type I restriction enzyme S subunit